MNILCPAAGRWRLLAALGALAFVVGLPHPAIAQSGGATGDGYLFHDSHFHLTNYIQEGTGHP